MSRQKRSVYIGVLCSIAAFGCKIGCCGGAEDACFMPPLPCMSDADCFGGGNCQNGSCIENPDSKACDAYHPCKAENERCRPVPDSKQGTCVAVEPTEAACQTLQYVCTTPQAPVCIAKAMVASCKEVPAGVRTAICATCGPHQVCSVNLSFLVPDVACRDWPPGSAEATGCFQGTNAGDATPLAECTAAGNACIVEQPYGCAAAGGCEPACGENQGCYEGLCESLATLPPACTNSLSCAATERCEKGAKGLQGCFTPLGSY